MDGNGRWAEKRNLSRAEGHRAGMRALRRTVEACRDLGIEILTVYAFSTENWKRPRDEVDALMDLLGEWIHKEQQELLDNDVQVRVIGFPGPLPPETRRALDDLVKATSRNKGAVLCLALNYGGRREIVEAARRVAEKAARGLLDPATLDEKAFEAELETAGIPEPDLLIRPSGEMRLSNFLLWQIAYTELWFTPVLWPDFQPEHLAEAVEAYRSRDRRYGGLHEDKD
ncbi:MAG: isoprenyl transferase [Bacillota bacterium]|nr:MAG: isoprenyl transferase [Bacillota bacterium]